MTENQHTGNPSARQALLDLAERCEREEPNDELNWSIMEAVRPDHGQTQATPYAHSIDAAVTLVPEGFAWSASADKSATADVNKWGEISERGRAKTPALALCVASLRARAGEA